MQKYFHFFYLTTWDRHLVVIKLFLLHAFQDTGEIKHFLFFFFLCKYYTTVLEQNICYASPKPNCHLFMLISFFLVFFFSFELFIFCATRSKQRVTKNQENPLKTLKDKIFLSCLLDRLHFGPRWFPFGNMSTEQTCHGLWLSYMESHSGQWGRYALCWCFCLEDNMLDV